MHFSGKYDYVESFILLCIVFYTPFILYYLYSPSLFISIYSLSIPWILVGTNSTSDILAQYPTYLLTHKVTWVKDIPSTHGCECMYEYASCILSKNSLEFNPVFFKPITTGQLKPLLYSKPTTMEYKAQLIAPDLGRIHPPPQASNWLPHFSFLPWSHERVTVHCQVTSANWNMKNIKNW